MYSVSVRMMISNRTLFVHSDHALVVSQRYTMISWINRMTRHMQKRYFCFECGTNVLEEKMEDRIAGWFGICKQCNKNNIYSVNNIKEKSLI
jgi:ribosomal protein L44E